MTRERVLEAVEAIKIEVDTLRSRAAAEQAKPWGLHEIPFGEAFEAAVHAIIVLCDTPNIERDAWPLVLGIDAFAKAFTTLARRTSMMLPLDTVSSHDLWTSWEALQLALTPRPKTPVETPQTLAAQGVSHTHIARMLKWFAPNGNPDAAKVRDELTYPGRHFRPDDYQHPADVRYAAHIAQEWTRRCHTLELRHCPPPPPSLPRMPAQCMETLDKLLQQGVGAPQIAKMKNILLSEVYARATLLGIDTDDRPVHLTFASAQRAREERRRKHVERQAQLARINTHSELGGDWTGRIRAMLQDGTAPRDVWEALNIGARNVGVDEVLEMAESLSSRNAQQAGAPSSTS